MTEQEKEIIDLFFETLNKEQQKITGGSVDISRHAESLAKAIIQRYPQITKKPVKVAFYDNLKYFPARYCPVIEETLKEEKRQEWIDSHYVQVTNEPEGE